MIETQVAILLSTDPLPSLLATRTQILGRSPWLVGSLSLITTPDREVLVVAGHNHSQDREAVGHTQDRHTPVRVHSRILEVVVPVVEEVGSKSKDNNRSRGHHRGNPVGPVLRTVVASSMGVLFFCAVSNWCDRVEVVEVRWLLTDHNHAFDRKPKIDGLEMEGDRIFASKI
jgi:hypothetical protein